MPDVTFAVSAQSVAKAMKVAIDGVAQVTQLRERAKLELQEKQLQSAELEAQFSLLEREKQQLAIEKHRLELLKKQAAVQEKAIAYSLEVASKIVDVLQPNTDKETKIKLMQTLLPNLLQLGSVEGFELVLPEPQEEILAEVLEKPRSSKISPSLLAITHVSLEEGNKAFVGKEYSIQAGVAWDELDKARNVIFDLWLLTAENLRPTIDWHKSLQVNSFTTEPQLTTFGFEVLAPGQGSLAIDIYHKRYWLRTIRIQFECINKK
jgi:Skp family chaperone for outer membrane proteins